MLMYRLKLDIEANQIDKLGHLSSAISKLGRRIYCAKVLVRRSSESAKSKGEGCMRNVSGERSGRGYKIPGFATLGGVVWDGACSSHFDGRDPGKIGRIGAVVGASRRSGDSKS
ncbi:hypothetical protein CHS0354_033539 [Potamilus streckersoni]|uniref:Uncharacterized protein n=1 Tax=Potamilus streckersoni TaxID=2493646 RepID=A0AAE0T194_9BIVA|nr:hypothetical protein CHS0354_033539 [Potamilus streckersoni]